MEVPLFLIYFKRRFYLFFSGVNCELRDLCAAQPCQNSGKCVSMNTGFTCKCLPGFDGPTCSNDVDECTINRTICMNGGTCQNLHGSYRYCYCLVLCLLHCICCIVFVVLYLLLCTVLYLLYCICCIVFVVLYLLYCICCIVSVVLYSICCIVLYCICCIALFLLYCISCIVFVVLYLLYCIAFVVLYCICCIVLNEESLPC